MLKGIPPGDYRIFAIPGLLPAEGSDPDFVRGRFIDAQEITLVSSQSAALTLTPSDDSRRQ